MFLRKSVLILSLLCSGCINVNAATYKWDFASDIAFYENLYKSHTTAIGDALGDLKYSANTKAFKSFNNTLTKINISNFDKNYVYYEISVNDGHYFYLWLGIKNDKCESFYITGDQLNKQNLNCRDIILSPTVQKFGSDQLIIHGFFTGLHQVNKGEKPQRSGYINPRVDFGLGKHVNIFDKIEMIFGKKSMKHQSD